MTTAASLLALTAEIHDALRARTVGKRAFDRLPTQAEIDALPHSHISIKLGDYTLDTLTSGTELFIRGGGHLEFARGSTITVNNPTRGCLVITDSHSQVSGVKVLGSYGVNIFGQERPDFGWNAGDAAWVTWRLAWNTAHPSYPFGSAAVLSFKDAWNAALPHSPVGDYYGDASRGRNTAIYCITGNDQKVVGCRAYNFNNGFHFRGVSTSSAGRQSRCVAFDLEADYCDQGLVYRQQDGISWDLIRGVNGADIVHAAQHAIYATGDYDLGETSTAFCGRAYAYNWQGGAAFKFKEGHRFLTPPDLSADDCQAVLACTKNCVGSLGPVLLTDQNLASDDFSGGGREAIAIIDCPDLNLACPPKVYARTSVIGAEQDALKFMTVTGSPRFSLADGWVYKVSRYAGAASPAGYAIKIDAASSDAAIGRGDYTDAGAQDVVIVNVNDSDRVRIGQIRSVGSKFVAQFSGASSDCAIDVDSLAVVNWNETTSIQTLGTGTGNVRRRFDGVRTIVPQTANYTHTGRGSGSVYTNAGAVAQVQFSLPAATTATKGTSYTYMVEAVQNVRVKAQSGDFLYLAGVASASAGRADCATPGSRIEFTLINTTMWVGIASGPWTLT
jgi:hypothetical protein